MKICLFTSHSKGVFFGIVKLLKIGDSTLYLLERVFQLWSWLKKLGCALCFFKPFLSVWISGETLFLVFDILLPNPGICFNSLSKYSVLTYQEMLIFHYFQKIQIVCHYLLRGMTHGQMELKDVSCQWNSHPLDYKIWWHPFWTLPERIQKKENNFHTQGC